MNTPEERKMWSKIRAALNRPGQILVTVPSLEDMAGLDTVSCSQLCHTVVSVELK